MTKLILGLIRSNTFALRISDGIHTLNEKSHSYRSRTGMKNIIKGIGLHYACCVTFDQSPPSSFSYHDIRVNLVRFLEKDRLETKSKKQQVHLNNINNFISFDIRSSLGKDRVVFCFLFNSKKFLPFGSKKNAIEPMTINYTSTLDFKSQVYYEM